MVGPLGSAATCTATLLTETIGDRVAELRDHDCNGKHYTSARWRTPEIYLAGEAADGRAAFLQLQIYRTVRPMAGR